MKTTAVIAEFNPFHNGHRVLLQRARERGADRVLVLMSGNFVQRGEPACVSRWVRAEAALHGGADLVLAYPSRYASSSAESFAYHAVYTLDQLHCVDELLFGSECGDPAPLLRCAELLAEEPVSYKERLREGLKEGLSFPKARARALPEYSSLLASPNNILAIEYMKALLRTHSAIRPATVLREGEAYLSEESCTSLPSALALRKALRDGADVRVLSEGVPEETAAILTKELGSCGLADPDAYTPLLAERLWNAQEAAELCAYAEVTEELARTCFRRRTELTDFESFAELCCSKSLTCTHVRRALLHISLGLRRPEREVHITQVLGLRRGAEDLLSEIRRKSTIPVLVRPAAESAALCPEERRLFEEELRVSNLYEALRALRSKSPVRHELTRKLLKI